MTVESERLGEESLTGFQIQVDYQRESNAVFKTCIRHIIHTLNPTERNFLPEYCVFSERGSAYTNKKT